MIKFESIPLNILRPALEAYAHAAGLGILPDDEAGEDWDEDYLNGMRAAIAAALNAWTGMLTERRARCDAVVLPYNLDADLPQEDGDGK